MTEIVVSDSKLSVDFVLSKSKAKDLQSVKKLNCWACNLKDISLLNEIPNIEILTLSVNNISGLENLQNCHNLCELYLRNNEIEHIDEIYYLKNLKNLKILWLGENKCVNNSNYNYRMTVLRNLPHLEKLDNDTVNEKELEECIKLGKLIESPPLYLETLNDTYLIRNELDKMISPLTDNIKCLNTNEVSYILEEASPLINKSDDELLTESVNSNFKLNQDLNYKKHSDDDDDDIEEVKLNGDKLQSDNVLKAVMALIKDLNLERLDLVIKECEYRKTLFS